MNARTRRLLVVDLDADVRNVIEDLLVDRGFEVHQAANGDEAILELRHGGFEVLLCHLDVLRARGGHLARWARGTRPTPWIIAMSGSGAQAGADEADANLAKPFSRTQLLQSLRPSEERAPPREEFPHTKSVRPHH